jgi:hypothetical protein
MSKRDEGKQTVLPGAEKIADKELLERMAKEPMRAKVKQEAPGGLFGDSSKQLDLVELSRKTEAGHQKEV